MSAVTATTAFEYESMHAALSVSVERLPACDRDTLACAVILPSEQDIPLQASFHILSTFHDVVFEHSYFFKIWALVVPVDLVDADESEFLMLLSDRLTRLCENGDWLSHSKQSDTFKFSRMVEIYLRETVEAQTFKVCMYYQTKKVIS